ncbi:MAG TPA: hypothetical protein VI998_04220 [Patescibacteria group bacterium]|nr:hypothetical protein [Patescibacteria group bacterium]
MTEFIVYLFVVIFSAMFFVALIGCVRSISVGHFWNTLGCTFRWFIGTDNRRWVTLLGLTLIVSGIAVTHPGDGLSKPSMDRFRATSEVRSLHEIDEKYDNLTRFGKMATNAQLCENSYFSEANAEMCNRGEAAYRSWIWWKLAIFFWLATAIYFFPAFWDDVVSAGGRTYDRIAESSSGEARLQENWSGKILQWLSGRKSMRPIISTTGGGGVGESPTPGPGLSTGRIFFREIIASLIPELLVEWRNIFGRR